MVPKGCTVVPPGNSMLRILLAAKQFSDLTAGRGSSQILDHVAVGFTDRNGRDWTRRLDGKLMEGMRVR